MTTKEQELIDEIEYWKTSPITRTKYQHLNQRILQRKVDELKENKTKC